MKFRVIYSPLPLVMKKQSKLWSRDALLGVLEQSCSRVEESHAKRHRKGLDFLFCTLQLCSLKRPLLSYLPILYFR
jgi:hypothetical protein